ncbi:hypothetical protein KIL84_018114 [Mauremys mutica]|uniref:Uncharacterized protein n=1 Tax=Mauremys mutica TaxID=74926 RepID=A0A9D3XUC1_9SAUR|nr:hypothetical protein KIL84_018114 [Mauremys mutica]
MCPGGIRMPAVAVLSASFTLRSEILAKITPASGQQCHYSVLLPYTTILIAVSYPPSFPQPPRQPTGHILTIAGAVTGAMLYQAQGEVRMQCSNFWGSRGVSPVS